MPKRKNKALKKSFVKDRKAFVGDIPTYLIALFFLSIVFISIYYALTQINTAWQDNPNLNARSKTIMSTFRNRFDNVYDNVFLILVIGFFITIIVLAYFLRTAPAFAWLAILLLIIFGVVAVSLSNAFHSFANSPGISDVSSDFPMLSFLAQRFPHIIIILGVIFVVILYSKSQQEAAL